VYGNTPLIEAVAMGSGEITKFLLDKGADVNRANNKSITALHTVGYLDDSGENILARHSSLLLQLR
jgi:ankyrin repeat protein